MLVIHQIPFTNVMTFYECYEGPIYFYGTNNKVPENELCEGYNYSGGVDPREQYRVTGRKGRI